MVTLEYHRLLRSRAQDQAIEHAAGIRAAVHIVADQNLNRPGNGVSGDMGVDAREQPVEQIGAAMDVADRIDADPLRQQRRATLASPRQKSHGFDRAPVRMGRGGRG